MTRPPLRNALALAAIAVLGGAAEPAVAALNATAEVVGYEACGQPRSGGPESCDRVGHASRMYTLRWTLAGCPNDTASYGIRFRFDRDRERDGSYTEEEDLEIASTLRSSQDADAPNTVALPDGAYRWRAEARCDWADDDGFEHHETQTVGPLALDVDAKPIIFLPGFLGTEIYCRGIRVWGDVAIDVQSMELSDDGVTPSTCPSSSPVDGRPPPGEFSPFGRIVTTVARQDVYADAVEWLEKLPVDDFPDDGDPGGYPFDDGPLLYVYDWRRDPTRAVAGLEALVEAVRRELDVDKVTLVGHSMGGLVVKAFVEDPLLRTYVRRVLTLGTPYWGSAKAWFPLAHGVESPMASGLDALIANKSLRSFARNLAGAYSLFPSARYYAAIDGWLSTARRAFLGDTGPETVLKPKRILKAVDALGGNSDLLEQAWTNHERLWDTPQATVPGKFDYVALVGTGEPTIWKVREVSRLGLDNDVEYVIGNGDGTVPQLSQEALWAKPQIKYACHVGHVALPGNGDIQRRVTGYVDLGLPIGGGGSPCRAAGQQIDIWDTRRTPEVGIGSGSAGRARASATLSLSAAVARGLVQVLSQRPGRLRLLTSAAHPVTLTARGRRLSVVIQPVGDVKRRPSKQFGPVKGAVTLRAGAKSVALRSRGRKVRARRADRKPPVTRVRVRRRGKRLVLTFRARDASGVVSTFVRVGGGEPTAARRGRATVPAKRRRAVRFGSVDSFGNVERPKRLR